MLHLPPSAVSLVSDVRFRSIALGVVDLKSDAARIDGARNVPGKSFPLLATFLRNRLGQDLA
ncbi:MAG: hypothetical protein JWM19_2557, partial [Actinomycetia bacterium]|nr:hypothetical protein [Actinomycetes bacterium]